MTWLRMIEASWAARNSLICVGLDPDPEKIPACLRDESEPIFGFCKAIVEATADLVCAYKPQIAYFAAARAETQLEKTIAFIHARFPDIPVILDAKRGDIGATAVMYAHEAFVRYKADAVTVNPYMGGDTLSPYLSWREKGVAILCRTSNPGSAEFQNLVFDGVPLYLRIAEKAATEWNIHRNVMLVAGATCPEELAEIRRIVGDMPLLVPGVGAQGADIAATVAGGRTDSGAGMIINSSRAIIYADTGIHFAAAARDAAATLRDAVNRYR